MANKALQKSILRYLVNLVDRTIFSTKKIHELFSNVSIAHLFEIDHVYDK